MKIIEKPVYYCEYCKKHGLSRHAMEIHEKHCTLNPRRACRMCGTNPAKVLIVKRPRTKAESHDITQAIKNHAGDCPACILAIIRQSISCAPDDAPVDEWPEYFGTVGPRGGFNSWNYKDAVASWWSDANEDNYGGYCY